MKARTRALLTEAQTRARLEIRSGNLTLRNAIPQAIRTLAATFTVNDGDAEESLILEAVAYLLYYLENE